MRQPTIDEDLVRAIPKTDLHVHLDGSLRLETMLELAADQGVTLPADQPDDLRRALQLGERHTDLVSYLEAFDHTCAVMQTREALERTAFELAEDAARENVTYMEVRYSPILHTAGGLRLDQVVLAVLDGLASAERRYEITTGVIICGIRNISPETSLQLAELACAFKNRGVVGFDLAGAEENFPAKHHRRAFYLILNNNINCTIHAGEAYGPESIGQAVHYCGAHRIGHGTRLREDGDLLNYVNDHRIPLEMCISSNLQTGSAKSLDRHPFRFYLDLGLRVTLNTDNRLITQTTVTQEYLQAARHYGLSVEELRWVMVNGFKSAFLPFRDKKMLLRRATTRYDEVVAEALGVEVDAQGKEWMGDPIHVSPASTEEEEA